MIMTGQTPLYKLKNTDISPQQEHILTSIWVESAEEFAAIMAAVEVRANEQEHLDVNNLRALQSGIFANVPKEDMMRWQKTTPGGMLGCKMDPNVAEQILLKGRFQPKQGSRLFTTQAALPPSVRLMDRLPEIQDQGRRGTCVAFSVTALREFYTDPQEKLSEQYLYYICKMLDGIPDEAGTYVRTAISALNLNGICRTETWPYNPENMPGNEGQAPAPDGADDEAREFIMESATSVPTGNVNSYKQILAGDETTEGMPIAIGAAVFDSWFLNEATRESGKIFMPLPGEEPVGGHAMLVVGYQDDTSVPGGGYFIVRNSWGTDWAFNSPEQAGHAMMPYAFVERYVFEAFSGPRDEITEPKSDFEKKYTRVLEDKSEDMEGKKLHKGCRVICNPISPGEFYADTHDKRIEFENRGFCWSQTTLNKLWFMPKELWPIEFSKEMNLRSEFCSEFMAVAEQQLRSSIKSEIPEISGRESILPKMFVPHRVEDVSMIKDISEDLIVTLVKKFGQPENVNVNAEWKEYLLNLNAMKVFTLNNGKNKINVVHANMSPFMLNREVAPEFKRSSESVLQSLLKLYYDSDKKNEEIYTFFLVCSATGWNERVESREDNRSVVIPVAPKENAWAFSKPNVMLRKSSFRQFLDTLYPTTNNAKLLKVKEIVDEYIESLYEGNILIRNIEAKSGLDRKFIENVFDKLEQSGDYILYETKNGVAIKRR